MNPVLVGPLAKINSAQTLPPPKTIPEEVVENPIGASFEDSPFDQAVDYLKKNKLIGNKGFKTPQNSSYTLPPEFDTTHLRSFIDRPNVENVLYFTPEILAEARKYFRSPHFMRSNAGQESELKAFFDCDLMTGKDRLLQYWMNPLEFYQKLYAAALELCRREGVDEKLITIEVIGGHARHEIFHADNGASWAERRLNQTTPHLKLQGQLGNEVMSRLVEHGVDLDVRFTLPGASAEILNELSYTVISLIVDQVKLRYPIFQDEVICNYLKIFIKHFGLEKFSKAPLNPKEKSSYSITTVKGAQRIEFMFANKLQRPCVFALDAMRIPIKTLIDPSIPSFFNKPYAGTADDLQALLDNIGYILHYPLREVVEPSIVVRGLSHQIRGARYLEEDLERYLLQRLLDEPLKEGVKPEVGLANLLSDLLLKCALNHADNDFSYSAALAIRALCCLKKYDEILPKGLISRTLKSVEPLLRSLVSHKNDHLFQYIVRPLLENGVGVDPVYNILQLGSLLRLNVPFDQESALKAYLTEDGCVPTFILQNGLCVSVPCQINKAAMELEKNIERLAGEGETGVAALLDALLPSIPLDFKAMTPLKRHFSKLNVDVALLKSMAIQLLQNKNKHLLRKIGVNLLLHCHAWDSDCDHTALILEALPKLLVVEHPSNELLLQNFTQLLRHKQYIKDEVQFFKATAEKLRLKQKHPENLVSTLIQDILASGQKKLEPCAFAIWKEASAHLSDSKKTLKEMGLSLIKRLPFHVAFSLHIFHSLQNARVLNAEESIPLFDQLAAQLSGEKDWLQALYKAAQKMVADRTLNPADKTPYKQSRELPRFIQILITAGSVLEGHDLLIAGAEKKMIDVSYASYKSCWIHLCSMALKTLGFNECHKYWQEAKVLKIWNLETEDEINLIVEIIDKLTETADADDKYAERYIHHFLSLLSEKKLRPEVQDKLRPLVLKRLNKRLDTTDNIQTVLNEFKTQFKNVVQEKQWIEFQLAFYQSSVEKEAPLKAIPLLKGVLGFTLDETHQKAVLDITEKLLDKLCNPEETDNFVDRFTMVHNFLKKAPYTGLLKMRPELSRKLKFLYLKSKNWPNIGWILLELLSVKEAFSAEELKLIAWAAKEILLQNNQENTFPKYFATQLKESLPYLVEAYLEHNLHEEAWDLLTPWINYSIDLPFTPSLLGVAQKLLDDSEKSKHVDSVLTGLNWFKNDDASGLKSQIDCYVKLTKCLLDKDSKRATVWIERCLTLSKENIPPKYCMQWIRYFLESDLSFAMRLFDLLNNNLSHNREDHLNFLYALLKKLRDQNFESFFNVLLQQNKTFALHPKAPNLLDEVIQKLTPTSPTLEDCRKLMRLLLEYKLDKCDEWLRVLNLAYTRDYLDLVDLMYQGWEQIAPKMSQELFNDNLIKILELLLKSQNPALLRLLTALKTRSYQTNYLFADHLCRKWYSLKKEYQPQACYYLDQLSQNFNDRSMQILTIITMIKTEIPELVNYANARFLSTKWATGDLYAMIPHMLNYTPQCPQLKTDTLLKNINIILENPEDFDPRLFSMLLDAMAEHLIEDPKLVAKFFVFAIDNLKNPSLVDTNNLNLIAAEVALNSYVWVLHDLIQSGRLDSIFSEETILFLKGTMAMHIMSQALENKEDVHEILFALDFANDCLDSISLREFPKTFFSNKYHLNLLNLILVHNNPLLFHKYLFKLGNLISPGFIPSVPAAIECAEERTLSPEQVELEIDKMHLYLSEMHEGPKIDLEKIIQFREVLLDMLALLLNSKSDLSAINTVLILVSSMLFFLCLQQPIEDESTFGKIIDLQKKLLFWDVVDTRSNFLLNMFFLSQIKMSIYKNSKLEMYNSRITKDNYAALIYQVFVGAYPRCYMLIHNVLENYETPRAKLEEFGTKENPLVKLTTPANINKATSELITQLCRMDSIPSRLHAVDLYRQTLYGKEKGEEDNVLGYCLEENALRKISDEIFQMVLQHPFLGLKENKPFKDHRSYLLLVQCLPVINDPRADGLYLFEVVQECLLNPKIKETFITIIKANWIQPLGAIGIKALESKNMHIMVQAHRAIVFFLSDFAINSSNTLKDRLTVLTFFSEFLFKLSAQFPYSLFSEAISSYLYVTQMLINGLGNGDKTSHFIYTPMAEFWMQCLDAFGNKNLNRTKDDPAPEEIQKDQTLTFSVIMRQRGMLYEKNSSLRKEDLERSMNPFAILGRQTPSLGAPSYQIYKMVINSDAFLKKS